MTLTPERLREEMAKDPTFKARLAAAMVTPIRCGGSEYIDGVLHLRLGGWLVPNPVVAQGWDAIHAYQATHEKYTLPERGRGRKKTP